MSSSFSASIILLLIMFFCVVGSLWYLFRETNKNKMKYNKKIEKEKLEKFEEEVCKLINSLSIENYSNTPDFIIAKYLTNCLRCYNTAVQERDNWMFPLEFKLDKNAKYTVLPAK